MTLAVLVAWKLSFYGELLPTAFYSKSAASPYYVQGLRYVGLYLVKSWYLVPALIVVPWLARASDRPAAPGGAAASERNDRLVFLATAGFLAAYVLHSGGDFMFARRLVPIAPFLLLALESWLVSIERRVLYWTAALVLVAGAALPYPVFGEGRWRIEGIADEPHFYPPEAVATRRQQGERLGALLRATPARVMFEGGMCMFAYYSRLPYLVEMTGLTQYSLARLPLAERGLIGHEKQPDDRWLDQHDIHFVVAQEWPIAPPPPGGRTTRRALRRRPGQGPHQDLLGRRDGSAARAPGGLVRSDRAGDRAPARRDGSGAVCPRVGHPRLSRPLLPEGGGRARRRDRSRVARAARRQETTGSGRVTRPPMLARILGAIPLRLVLAFGAAAGRLLYALSPRFRRDTRANLALAFPDATLGRRLEISAGAGRAAIEGVRVLVRPPAESAARVREAIGWEAVEAALADGSGVLLISPHLGCFEIVGPFGSEYPMTGALPAESQSDAAGADRIRPAPLLGAGAGRPRRRARACSVRSSAARSC